MPGERVYHDRLSSRVWTTGRRGVEGNCLQERRRCARGVPGTQVTSVIGQRASRPRHLRSGSGEVQIATLDLVDRHVHLRPT
nr:hypothetical protein CFP56_01227 [Quercus suber]